MKENGFLGEHAYRDAMDFMMDKQELGYNTQLVSFTKAATYVVLWGVDEMPREREEREKKERHEATEKEIKRRIDSVLAAGDCYKGY